MAFYITENMPQAHSVCVHVYRNDREYIGNVVVSESEWQSMSEAEREDLLTKYLGNRISKDL